MRCPKCGCLDDKVNETRMTKEGDAIRRRRECADCEYRYTTRETISPTELMVVKRDDSREEFSAAKLRAGLRQACWKRTVSERDLDRIVTEVVEKLSSLEKREVASRTIGDLAMRALRNVDEVAYVRFASIYHRFEDVDEFISEVNNLSDVR